MHQSPITAPGPADRIATSRRALGRTLLFLLLLGVAFAAGPRVFVVRSAR